MSGLHGKKQCTNVISKKPSHLSLWLLWVCWRGCHSLCRAYFSTSFNKCKILLRFCAYCVNSLHKTPRLWKECFWDATAGITESVWMELLERLASDSEIHGKINVFSVINLNKRVLCKKQKVSQLNFVTVHRIDLYY